MSNTSPQNFMDREEYLGVGHWLPVAYNRHESSVAAAAQVLVDKVEGKILGDQDLLARQLQLYAMRFTLVTLLTKVNPNHDTLAMAEAVLLWESIVIKAWTLLGQDPNIPTEWMEESMDVWPGDLVGKYQPSVGEVFITHTAQTNSMDELAVQIDRYMKSIRRAP